MNRRDFLALTAAFPALAGMAPGKRYRVGVIGHTGRGNYGHGLDTMWKEVPGCEIVAVADADEAGLSAAKKKLGVDNVFRDYRAMLAKSAVDIVAVAPRFLEEHRDMAVAAAQAGARGIYMEKPFCRTPSEADEIVAACAKSGTRCAVAHRNRWHPALIHAKKLVDEGGIGRVLEVRCRGKEDARGGGLDLWVLGTHDLNLATFFTGPAVACTATMLNAGKPATPLDVVQGAEASGPLAGNELHARYETESGIPIFFDSIAKAGTPEVNFGLQIVGTKGFIDFRIDLPKFAHVVFGSPTLASDTPREWTPITSGGVGKPEPDGTLHQRLAGHILPALDLIAAIEENRPPLCSDKDGAMTVEMVCAAFASHRNNSARVALPLENRDHPLAGWK
ncbi:putative oxidoreductase YdgJ [Caulifigura coniformis]|uniref:Putative oxidoreductase YdgJ n=1 Tax=Caulifigura coniformis TaxID=2527983 RepID=A0A517SAP0_9PLAN|nr:Gfo/Idh/MocA family oxidoreductase [Caulifigura coniformis]QDT53182.1 putative oxidoreductase YdgJ [Caulifigura coniformis]